MNKEGSRTGILEREGWTRQFIASEPRLSEALELYEEMGYEVHLEPFSREDECESCGDIENGSACRACYEGFEDRYRTIFTRPKRIPEGPDTLR